MWRKKVGPAARARVIWRLEQMWWAAGKEKEAHAIFKRTEAAAEI